MSREAKFARAWRTIRSGLLWTLVGVLLTSIAYVVAAETGSQRTVLFWGATLVGVSRVIWGFLLLVGAMLTRSRPAPTRQVVAAPRWGEQDPEAAWLAHESGRGREAPRPAPQPAPRAGRRSAVAGLLVLIAIFAVAVYAVVGMDAVPR